MQKKLSRKNQSGQGITEYILIIALVAIASIAVLTIFGDQIRSIFSGSAKQLAGDESATNEDQTSGVDAEVKKELDNW